MAVFALVYNGTICQIATATFPVNAALIWTTDISATSPAPQAGWSATQAGGTWAFAAPAAPLPTLAQQAQALLAAGLTVTSTSTPAISATYATDPTSIQKLIGIELGLAANQGFPAGATTFPLRTVTGTPPLLTPVQYTTIAALIRNFAAQADLVIDGLSTTLAAATATIA